MSTAQELLGGKGLIVCLLPWAVSVMRNRLCISQSISFLPSSHSFLRKKSEKGRVAKIFLGKVIQFSSYMRDSLEISGNGRTSQTKQARGWGIRLCLPAKRKWAADKMQQVTVAWAWTTEICKSEGRVGCYRWQYTGIIKCLRTTTDCQHSVLAGEMCQPGNSWWHWAAGTWGMGCTKEAWHEAVSREFHFSSSTPHFQLNKNKT